MNKLTTSSILLLILTISISILAVGLPARAQDNPAQEPIPAPWPEEPGAMPELLGGKKAERPMVFIVPETSSNDRQSADEITFDIWYGGTQNFGQNGNPQQWVNILGNVTSPFGVQSLTYTFKGVEKPLTIGPGKPRNPRLVNDGDFNIEIDYTTLNPGANVITLKAVEGVTNIVKEQNVTINYTSGQVWPEAYKANWATAAKIEDVAQIIDGKWDINGAGKLYVQEVGYDRLVGIGEMEYPTGAPTVWTDYEVSVPIKVNGLDESGFEGVSNGPGIGLLMRWQGQTQRDPANPDQPALDWERTGGLGWYRWQEKDGAEGLELRGYDWTGGTSTAKVWEFGVEYIMKMSVQTDVKDPTRAYYRLKFWKAGTKEPVSWDLQGFSKPNNSPSGSVVLIAHHVDAEFGQVTVEPLADLMYTLNATKTGMGEITLTSHTPGQTIFQYGETVRILAIPAANHILDSWSGDLSLPGTVNPLVLSMTSDVNVTANFKEALPGKLTVKIQGEGTVIKDPDKEQYNGGEFVTLTATPKPGNIFAGWTGDLETTLNPATIQIAGDKTVTAKFISAGEASPISDDFNQCELDTSLWQFVNPAGDATLSSTGTTVKISVPAGDGHSMWPTVNTNAPRIMQTTKNQDFTIDVKFKSIPSQKYQIEGLLVQQDSNNYLRFDIWSDGDALRMFAGGFVNGATQAKSTIVPTSGSTLSTIYMRVSRVGDSWDQTYSFDGVTWQGPQGFVQALTVNSTGIFAANEPATGAPAWTLEVDYFHNAAFPVGNTGYLLSTDMVGDGSIQLSPEPDANGCYACNQLVTLFAVPSDNFTFTGWSGDLSGAQNPATLTMNGDKSVTANFGRTYKLITTVEGQGQVLRDPDQLRYVEGDEVTLTAVPEKGWVFSGWTGDLTGDENPVSLAIDGRKVVTANFVEAFLLNTSVNGSGQLKIDPQKDAYFAGDKVTLTAVPEKGWVFSGWSGDRTGDDNPTILTMDAHKSVTAVFVETYTLSTTLRGNGQLIVDPKQDAYFAGDKVTLTALPEPGWVFSGWCGDLTGDENPAALIIDGNMVVVAQFERTFALTTAVLGSGQLIVDPHQETYIAGEPVTLTAVPDRGWTFTGWIGDAAGHSNPLVVRVDRNKHIIASFSKIAIYMPAVLRP